MADEFVMLDWLEDLGESGLEVAERAIAAAKAVLRRHPQHAMVMLREVKIAAAWAGGERRDGIADVLGEDVGALCSYSSSDEGHTWQLWCYQSGPIEQDYENESMAMAHLDGLLISKGWAPAPQHCAGCNVLGFPSWLRRDDYPVLQVIGPAPDGEWGRFVCPDCGPAVHDRDQDEREEIEQRRAREEADAERRRATQEMMQLPGSVWVMNSGESTIPIGALLTFQNRGDFATITTDPNMAMGYALTEIPPGKWGVATTRGVGGGGDPIQETVEAQERLLLELQRANIPPLLTGLIVQQLGSARRYLTAAEAELLRRYFQLRQPDPETLPVTARVVLFELRQELEEAAERGDLQATAILRGDRPIDGSYSAGISVRLTRLLSPGAFFRR